MLNKQSTFTKVSAAIVLFLLMALMATCFAPLARGTTSRPRPNSLGLSQTYQNPYVYMFGTIDRADVLSTATIVDFKPFGASLLGTESILFCGDLSRDLEGGDNTTLYVFTYRQQTSRTYHGIGCHEIFRILQLGEVK